MKLKPIKESTMESTKESTMESIKESTMEAPKTMTGCDVKWQMAVDQDVGLAFAVGRESDKRMVEENDITGIIFPWSKAYGIWWSITVVGAIFTLFFEPYQVAFQVQPGLSPFTDANAIVEYIMMAIFATDILVNFNLATYEGHRLIYDRDRIAGKYFSFMFWVDVCGVFPFVTVALLLAGESGKTTRLAVWLSLFRLLRLVRLHRIIELFEILQYNAHVSLFWLTITRNFVGGLLVAHFSACVMYFIARQYNFKGDTMLGFLTEESSFNQYVTSLYWSVVTLTTVGYGDFSPVNSMERIWGVIYMLLNMITCAWIIGSITLLIVKTDEKTGSYRDGAEVLKRYCAMHRFDGNLEKSLQRSLRLDFQNSDVTDEEVLKHFPSAVRRKILRNLYLPALLRTSLMRGIREEFVDAFLAACKVEIFSPGAEILHRGSISSDLYLLVGGIAEVVGYAETLINGVEKSNDQDLELSDGFDDPSDLVATGHRHEAGEFVGEIGFFTESPQRESICALTVCKTLTLSKSLFLMLSQDHPGSVGKILKNLLKKVSIMTELEHSNTSGSKRRAGLEKAASIRVKQGEVAEDIRWSLMHSQEQESLLAVKDLVTIHMNKLKDDHTTRFLFAASRNDVGTISLMCDQGFDPNNADYDMRTGLMVASMKGSYEAVKKILFYGGRPNDVDMHGTSALQEAVKNGHEDVIDVLLSHNAELCMGEGKAASILCETVFAGDLLMLRRLLRAKIPVNSADYDDRTAAHIAAAEGNVAALSVLIEFGADLTLVDRWDNTLDYDAQRSHNSIEILNFLEIQRSTSRA